MIDLVRDRETGKSKGFCFLCYEDQRSTVLAVDNFNGIVLCSRTLKVDHVKDYKPPKLKSLDKTKRDIFMEGVKPGSKYYHDRNDHQYQEKRQKPGGKFERLFK